jgi:RHS repeat-associated protein
VLARANKGDTDITEYEWDHSNRLVSVTQYATFGGAATGIFEYTYDVYGRRIAKDLDNDGDGTIDRSERYIYDGTDIVLDFVDSDGAGAAESTELTTRYLWGPAVDQLLAQDHVASDGTSTTSWTLTDHLGSVRDIVSYDASTDTTTVDDHFVYDSFGNITTGDTSVTRYLYTSQEYDTETGQYYYDARYYDQTTGKFLTTDPIKDDFDNPYRYVSNSPTNFIDPTGRVRSANPSQTAATRSIGDLREAGLKDAHHVIQDAAARDLPGYNTTAARGVQLPGPSTARGTPHYNATQVQRQLGGGTYAAERRIAYKALRRAGYTEVEARRVIQEADDYFYGIGVRPDTPTRIPGNRR